MPGNGGSWFLPRIVGEAKALELFWAADPIDSTEARQLGLVNQVFADEDFMDQVLVFARKVASRAPLAVRLVKRAARQLTPPSRDTSTCLILPRPDQASPSIHSFPGLCRGFSGQGLVTTELHSCTKVNSRDLPSA